MMTNAAQPGAVKAGEIIKPSLLYRFVPLGIVSGAVWGLQFIGLAAVLMGLAKDPSGVANSFQGEGLKLWLICGGVWLGLLILNLGLGSVVARRRFELTAEGVMIHGPFGGSRFVSRRNVTKVRTVYSVAALMQGTIDVRYADGTRKGVDGGGLNTSNLGRLATWLSKG